MTIEQLLAFASFLLLVTSLWLTIAYLVPYAARTLFERRIQAIRDALADDVIEDRMRADDPAVRRMLDFGTFLTEHAKSFTLSWSIAIYLAWEPFGLPGEDEVFSYAELDATQRRTMHEYEARLVEASSVYLFWGSHLWWVLVPLRRLSRVGVLRRFRPGSVRAATTRRFVREAAVEHTSSEPPAMFA